VPPWGHFKLPLRCDPGLIATAPSIEMRYAYMDCLRKCSTSRPGTASGRSRAADR